MVRWTISYSDQGLEVPREFGDYGNEYGKEGRQETHLSRGLKKSNRLRMSKKFQVLFKGEGQGFERDQGNRLNVRRRSLEVDVVQGDIEVS